jgi:hypothetical protein
MIKSCLGILIILVTTSGFSDAQPVFNYGPELGISISGKPEKVIRNYMNGGQSVRKTRPLAGLLLGFNGQLNLRKHLQLSFGIQYQLTGSREYYQSENPAYDMNSNPMSVNDRDYFTEQFTYHKLCLPLTAGYRFRTGRSSNVIYLGIRPNFIISGRYYNRITYDRVDDSGDKTYEVSYNPVDPEQAAVPLNLYNFQQVAGVSSTMGKHIKINLFITGGYQLRSSRDPLPPMCAVYHSFQNSELAFSLTYLLNPRN